MPDPALFSSAPCPTPSLVLRRYPYYERVLVAVDLYAVGLHAAVLSRDPDTIRGWRLDSETPFYRRVTSLDRLYDGHVKIRSVTPFVPVCPHYKP